GDEGSALCSFGDLVGPCGGGASAGHGVDEGEDVAGAVAGEAAGHGDVHGGDVEGLSGGLAVSDEVPDVGEACGGEVFGGEVVGPPVDGGVLEDCADDGFLGGARVDPVRFVEVVIH